MVMLTSRKLANIIMNTIDVRERLHLSVIPDKQRANRAQVHRLRRGTVGTPRFWRPARSDGCAAGRAEVDWHLRVAVVVGTRAKGRQVRVVMGVVGGGGKAMLWVNILWVLHL